MINSFRFINKSEDRHRHRQLKIDSREEQGKNTEDPLLILKRRFAAGQITEEEYERMKRIIEG